MSEHRGTDVEQRGVDQLHAGRQVGFVNGVARAGVDQDAVMEEDVFGAFPEGESLPVVGSDDEGEFPFRIGFTQSRESVGRVRRAGKVEFKVAGFEPGVSFHGELCQGKARVFVYQVCGFLLEGILGRHEKPHFVHPSFLADGVGQLHVAFVDGVE